MTKSESLHISNSQGNVTFLDDNMGAEEKQKVRMFIDIANVMIKQYFGVRGRKFDIVICSGDWEMEVLIVSRIKKELFTLQNYYDITKSVAITDNHLQEIVIR